MPGVQDLNVVLEAVETALGFSGVDLPAKPAVPVVPWAPHSEPRCQVFVDRETQNPLISLMFKKGHNTVSTPEGILKKIVVRSMCCNSNWKGKNRPLERCS